MPSLFNLHNHTPFSDGAYTIDELCEAHLRCGFEVAGVGISDHLFSTPSSRDVANDREFERLFGREARNYFAEVRAARERWQGRLQVICGVEINWPRNRQYLDLVRTMVQGADFVLFEFVDWAGLTMLANQARRWPCPVGLAHCDVEVQFPNTPMQQVVRTLVNARIFYEVNTKLMPLSDHEAWFRTLAQHRIGLTLGSDTHDDLGVIKTLPAMYDYLAKVGVADKLFVPQPRVEQAAGVS